MSEKRVKSLEIIMNDNESLKIVENRFLATIDSLSNNFSNLINRCEKRLSDITKKNFWEEEYKWKNLF